MENNLETILERFISVRKKAIQKVTEKIKELKAQNLDDDQYLIKELEHGLDVLNKGLERIKREGVEGIDRDIKRWPRGKRPGLGLSRGFGEFLWHGYDWEKEIMAAIDDIENYFRNM